MCPNEHPISSDWDKDLGEEEERKEQDKGENKFSVCSDWDADLEEQEMKNPELEDQKNNNRKTPQTGPKSLSVDAFTPKPSKSTTEQLCNQSRLSPETEVQKFNTLAT